MWAIDGAPPRVGKRTVGTRTCDAETARDRVVRNGIGGDGLGWGMLWLWLVLWLRLLDDSWTKEKMDQRLRFLILSMKGIYLVM
jgi:hypothetical protein